MKKVKFIVIFSLFCLASVFFILNGTAFRVFSIFLNYPNYVIITADEYYNNAKLQEFIQWKTSQGYTVQLEKVTTILNNYPISNPDDSYFLKVQNFENIQSSYTRVYALWYDDTNNKYVISAYHGIGYYSNGSRTFKSVNPPNEPKKVYLYIEGEGSKTIYLTYDGGKKLNVSVHDYPYCYTYFGEPLVTIEGSIYYYKTKAYSIVEYLKTNPNIKYLLLIGDTVPSFSVRRIDVASEMLYYSLTDYPYSAINFESTNKLMVPSFSVSRIPCDSEQELEVALNKIMNFQPYMTKKAVFIKGPRGFVPEDPWDEVYLELRNSVNQSLHYIYPDIYTYELIEPDKNTFLSNINSENSYAIIMAHGGTNTMWLSSSGYSLTIWGIYDEVKFYNATVITPHSCLVNDFSHFTGVECIGEAFLFDSDSNVPVFIGSTLPTNFGHKIIKYFYAYISTYKTVGYSLVHAKAIDFTIPPYVLIERLIWNILGDASLNLVTETVPPVEEYGWLDLSYTVNGETPTENALYSVVFPNNTVKTYSGIRITVNNCPVGSYQISCTYKNETKSQVVNVQSNQGTKVSFDFTVLQTGDIHVYCNIEAYVTVSGPINDSRIVGSSGWHLTDVPVGTYYLTASCEDVILTHTIVLNAGESVSYTFEFEVYEPTINYADLFNEYLPFIFIGLAIILVVKW